MSSSKRRGVVVSLSLSREAVAALDARVAAGEAPSRTALIERMLVGGAPLVDTMPAEAIREIHRRLDAVERAAKSRG